MNNKKSFTPQSLRAVLSTLLVIVIIGGGALFYFGLGMLRDYSIEVNQTLADASASASQVDELQRLKSQLAQSTSLTDKANQIFSTPQAYQSQALSDVQNYAAASGVRIANTNFEDASSGTYVMTLTLRQPVSYKSLITFLHNLEGNLPKLQVTSISLGHVAGGNADSVKTGEIKIGIAVR